MKTNMPITYVGANVVTPASGLEPHVKIQQHVGQIIQEPGYDKKHVLVAIRTSDLKRLFGEVIPREFYIGYNDKLTYVAMRQHVTDKDESFGTMIALNQKILEMMFPAVGESLSVTLGGIGPQPFLRMTVLANTEEFRKSDLADCVRELTQEEFDSAKIELKWDTSVPTWVLTDEPQVEEEPRQPKIHLRDIPLTTRANRRMVRASIAQASDRLKELHEQSASQLSFDDWMVQSQGVNMDALKDLEAIDNLPDEEYVEAMVTFKKAEAQAYHSQEVKSSRTDKHLFDWVLENFGEEFNDLGRASAMRDIQGIEPSEEMTQDVGDEKAIFLISFDGCIVENQRPSIGPESPFAMGIVKALAANGHGVFILSSRQNEERDDMLKFFEANEFQPIGICERMFADGQLQREDVNFIGDVSQEEYLDHEIDYLIDYRQFGIPTIQVSGKADADATMYWGDLAQSLTDMGYLSAEDLNNIMESLKEKSEEA